MFLNHESAKRHDGHEKKLFFVGFAKLRAFVIQTRDKESEPRNSAKRHDGHEKMPFFVNFGNIRAFVIQTRDKVF